MFAPGPVLRKRLIFLFFSVIAALAVLVERIAWIQLVRGQQLRVAAQEVRTRYIPVEARRGGIYDAKGRELAISISSDTVVANPAEIKNPEATADQLAAVLGMSRDEVMKIITRRSSFEFVQRKIGEDKARAVRRLRLPGIYLTQETRRVYPKGMLAANVIGFAGMDSQGLEGVEMVYDALLRGRPGSIVIEYDARNREIPQAVHRYVEPRDGYGLQLTIDETIQYIAERELDKVMERTRARAAWIVMMNPHNGEILAMAQRPSYDPNKAMDYLINGNPAGRADADPKLWRNLAISDAYPPGSVFKPVTAAMALEEGKVTPDTPFYDTGSLAVPGSVVHNWDGAGLGATNFTEGFARSANTIFARVGLMVGMDKFYQYLAAFGFTAPTGIDVTISGEATGLHPPKDDAKPLDLALMAFGQTLTVTPIQMLTATAALINGGKLVKPHVAKAVLDSEGRVVRTFEPVVVRRPISAATSATLRRLMGRVVDEGTGRRAKVPGYSIGGKTGTSQKVIGGRVSTDKHIASFLGFAPLEDPMVLCYVMVDEPQGMPYGGVVAAPVFEAVMRDTLHYLGVRPTRPVETTDQWGAPLDLPDFVKEELAGPVRNQVPDLVNLPVAMARQLAAAAGLEVSVIGQGDQVQRQVPPPGALVRSGTTVLVYTEAREAGTAPGLVTVPSLLGRPLREAAQILGALGLRMQVEGSGVAVSQEPLPDTRVAPGTRVRVMFAPPDRDVRERAGAGR